MKGGMAKQKIGKEEVFSKRGSISHRSASFKVLVGVCKSKR
jgi:hypothetical protein